MDYKDFVEGLKRRGIVVGDETVGYKVNPYLDMPQSLSFDDVSINQSMNVCDSRLDADIKSEVFRGVYLDTPMIASNMSAVVNADFCILLRKLGALGIMHRAFPVEQEYLDEVKKVARECDVVAASVGIGGSQLELAEKLIVHAGANVINIDIAHGYSQAVIDMGRTLKKKFPHIKLIVGNTINPEFMYLVADFADAVKVAIGTGSACITRYTAGCYQHPFSLLQNFHPVSRKLGLPIIQDGGIRGPSDFTKAIAAGANSCMMGGTFARCPESAAELHYVNGVPKKLYFGMASKEAQVRWKGGLKPGTCAEGKSLFLDIGEPAAEFIERFGGALRSGITYAGATDVKSFQDKVEFVRL
jgi:IMP dehydrogenase/GMP reductase